jgi:hypothetical protein
MAIRLTSIEIYVVNIVCVECVAVRTVQDVIQPGRVRKAEDAPAWMVSIVVDG